MSVEAVKKVQQGMKDKGFYTGQVDGAWGTLSQTAWDAMLAKHEDVQATGLDIAWSAKVSPEFVAKVKKIVAMLRMPTSGADDLMACMAWESAETFSSSVRNAAGSGATGLIQFMPATALPYYNTAAEIAKMDAATKKAKGLEACDRLAKLTPEQQLDFVYKYFEPYAGRLKNLGDLYMAILWPAGIGKADSFVLWDKASRPTTYRQNAGLDINKDDLITRAEALAKVNAKLTRGLQPQFRRSI